MPVNRDITKCVPLLQSAWAHLKDQWAQQYPDGPTIILVETFRSAEVQEAYYAQGRQDLKRTNLLRKRAGLAPIGVAENKRKITFKGAGHSKHERTPAQAFDVGFVADRKMVWDAVNYERAASIVQAAFPGVTWGADWNNNGKTSDERFVDQPHFEV